MDDIVAPLRGGTKLPGHPGGQFPLRHVDTIDLGYRIDQYQNQEPKKQRRVALVFQTAAKKDNGEYWEVAVEETLSASGKSNLRKFLGAWRGQKYEDKELELLQGLPLKDFANKTGLGTVEVTEGRDGGTWSNLTTIVPLFPGIPVPSDWPVYTRKTYWQERKDKYAQQVAEFDRKQAAKPVVGAVAVVPPTSGAISQQDANLNSAINAVEAEGAVLPFA